MTVPLSVPSLCNSFFICHVISAVIRSGFLLHAFSHYDRYYSLLRLRETCEQSASDMSEVWMKETLAFEEVFFFLKLLSVQFKKKINSVDFA